MLLNPCFLFLSFCCLLLLVVRPGQTRPTAGAQAENRTQTQLADFEPVNNASSSNSSELSDLELQQALAYLIKFGYLASTAAPDAGVQPDADNVTATTNSTIAELAEAVSKFQTVYQLSVTGQLDLDTRAAMREGRCGVADQSPTLKSSVRQRRSVLQRAAPLGPASESPRLFPTRSLTWQLGPVGRRLHRDQVTQIVRRAFVLWSSVAPIRFRQVFNWRDRADIQIGFYSRFHRGCPHPFDGRGGDAAHTQSAARIHIDSEEDFHLLEDSPVAGIRVHLLRLLVHEIGHLLGLGHSSDRSSIMHPSSISERRLTLLRGPTRRNRPLIGGDEVSLVRERYGQCSPKIDAIIDWRYAGSNGEDRGFDSSSTRVVSCGSVWTGQKGGFPDSLGRVWRGLAGLTGVDAVLQAESVDGRVLLSLAFSGLNYYELDSETGEAVGQPGEISADFGRQIGGTFAIPASLDAAYYDYDKRRAVFIKGEWAFEYNLLFPNGTLRKGDCCHSHTKLSRMFPPAPDNSKPLVTPVDAAYYRLSDSTVFLITGTDFWYFGSAAGINQTAEDADSDDTLTSFRPTNSTAPTRLRDGAEDAEQRKVLRYGGKVHQQWRNLCSVAEPSCDLNNVVKPQ